jgi:tetratricopeptide (TPR) repeat protein
LPFEWWRDTFKSAIQMIGKTVMIMTPWDQPIPITRAWCVWELFCTIDTKSTLEIALTRDQKIKFGEDLRKDVSKLELFQIKSEDSTAFKPEDKERIHVAIRTTVGFSRLDSMISTALYHWMTEAAKDVNSSKFFDYGKQLMQKTFLDERYEKNTEEYVFQQMLLAKLESDEKKFSSAETRLKECEQIYEKYGENWNHQEKVPMFLMLGVCYEGQGNLKEAEYYFHKRCNTYLQAFGESHGEYGKALNGVGAFYMRNENYPEAVTYFKKCIDNAKMYNDSTSELAAMNNLAYVYKEQGNYKNAEVLMQETLERSVSYFGKDSRQYLYYVMAIVNYSLERKNFAEAIKQGEDYFNSILTLRGIDHDDTTEAFYFLREIYEKEGDLLKIQTVCTSYLEKRTTASIYDEQTFVLIQYLARLYVQNRQFKLAEELLTTSISEGETHIGAEHEFVLSLKHYVGLSDYMQMKYIKAYGVLKACLKSCEEALGPDHSLTLAVKQTTEKTSQMMVSPEGITSLIVSYHLIFWYSYSYFRFYDTSRICRGQ